MFKIGEFSKLTQVSVRMLRYYDEAGLLKPSQIDSWTGYRLYSVEQIPVLNKIIYLRDSGFQVAEIAKALGQKNDDFIIEQLNRKHQEIEQAIQLEQEKLKKLELAKEELLTDKNELHYNISIKSIPSYQVLSLRRVVRDYYAEGTLWQEMSEFAKSRKLSISNQTFTIYHDTDYREQDVDIEICAPVEQMGEDADGFVFRQTEAVPLMASTMVYGPFQNIAGAYRNFAGWLQKHSQYRMGETSRQIVHRGPWNEKTSDKYLTEIQIPLENAPNITAD